MIASIFKMSLVVLMAFTATGCKDLDHIINGPVQSSVPTNVEASQGLIQALVKGMDSATTTLSVEDGFWGNDLVKIPFPNQAKTVKDSLERFGMGAMVQKTTLSLNRAAEKASGEAKDVLIASLRQMTFSDAMDILLGPDTAATDYLKRTTTSELQSRFSPIIEQSLIQVNATRYWEDVMGRYNQIPFTADVDTDLTSYVTEQALSGLFVMVAKKEKDIRQNPVQRTTELLQKVFGYAAAQNKQP